MLDTPNCPETQVRAEADAQGATFQVPNNLLGRLLDHGKASAHAIKMLCIKVAHFNFAGGALNEQHCREHYSIGWRAFEAGRRLLVKTGVLRRGQPNHRAYAVEKLAQAGRNYTEADIKLIKERAPLVAFVMATLLSPRPVRPADVAKRIGVESGNTVRNLALDATSARYVGRAVAPDGTAYVGRHKVIQEAVATPLKNGGAKNGGTKNGGAHMYWKKNTETESKSTETSERLARCAPTSLGGKLADADCARFLGRLTAADSTGALALRLKRNARGLGRFLAAMAQEHDITHEEVVGIIEERLLKHRVAGKPVDGEAEMNWFADPDDLYKASSGWIETWNYLAGLVDDQVKLRRWHERAEACS